MKKIVALLFALLLLLPLMAASAEGVVNVYNWQDYIDMEVIALFEQETGIKVNYMGFTLNEDMLVQVNASPASFDVVFPSDYAVERLVKDNLLMELDYEKLPYANQVVDWLKNPAYDPGDKYSVPYMWGTVGILYDTARVDGVPDSWAILLDEKYKGEVFMLDSFRDSLGVALKYLGYSMNTRNPAELNEAKDLLIKQKQLGVVRAYQVDETKDKMVAGEGSLAVVWSGDAQYAINESTKRDLAYVVPKEGSNVWVDAMVIPKAAQNPENAYKFIDFLSRPEIAKMNCDYIQYSSPNKGAIELMGEEYTSNPTLNPGQDVIDRCEFFHDVQDFIAVYNALWAQVKNAK